MIENLVDICYSEETRNIMFAIEGAEIMHVPKIKKKKKDKRHIYLKYPLIGKYFEFLGIFGWLLILLVIASIVMLLVPSWNPVWWAIVHKIGAAWNYIWEEFLPQMISWDWQEQPK